MASSSVRVAFEILQVSTVRSKITNQMTHDWELTIRGAENTDIHHFVDKVIFRLHETFENPIKTVKEPPYHIRECGYAGFDVYIDVVVKNKTTISFIYALELQSLEMASQGPITRNQILEHVFTNPTEDFRRKLIRGGGVGVSDVRSSNHSSHVVNDYKHKNKPISHDNKKPKKENPLNDGNAEFSQLFGTPITINATTSSTNAKNNSKINTEKNQSADKHVNTIKSSKHSSSNKDKDKGKERDKEKSKDREKEKYSKKNKEGGSKDEKKVSKSSLKDEHKKNHNHNEEKKEKLKDDKEKSSKLVKKDKEKHKEEKNRSREKIKTEIKKESLNTPDRVEKHQMTPTTKEEPKPAIKIEEKKVKHGSKNSLSSVNNNNDNSASNNNNVPDTIKKEKHKSHKHKRDKDKDTKRKHHSEKKEKVKDYESMTNDKDKEKDKVNIVEEVKNPYKSENAKASIGRLFDETSDNSDNDFPILTSKKESTPQPQSETVPIVKKDASSSSSSSLHNHAESKKEKSEKLEKSESKHKSKKSSSDDKESRKKKKKSRRKEDELNNDGVKNSKFNNRKTLISKEYYGDISTKPVGQSTPKEATVSVSINKCTDEYINRMQILQRKIMLLEDDAALQLITQIIASAGQYEIASKTFDFDLFALDESVVQKLMEILKS